MADRDEVTLVAAGRPVTFGPSAGRVQACLPPRVAVGPAGDAVGGPH